MPSIRKVKTASGATAVQVVEFSGGKRTILKHVGSAHSADDVAGLVAHARRFIERTTGQPSLFPEAEGKNAFLLEQTRLLRITHTFTRTFLHACATACGLDALDPVILDFAVMRIVEPSSKARAFELIEQAFGIRHSKRAYGILRSLHVQKDAVERAALSCARTVLRENLFFVLYDVTTLYFETFKADDLRSHGFSKDDKSKQPQIVIGLLATKTGFPLAHEVFPGKTFEGRTMLAVLEDFSGKHGVEMPVVVADAAMLSKDNIEELAARNIRYIVGGRLANTSPSFIRRVSENLSGQDGKILRLPTRQHGDMICSFSLRRYRRDKMEMDKQIQRAERLIAKNEEGRRAKFVQKAEGSVELNRKLITKTESLLGIKGYCTNIPEKDLPNLDVIACYHELWNVERAFRMSKHDLEARPIFHRKDEAVRAHILLCFIALMMGRYLEIATGMSLRKIRDLLWSIEEAHFEDTVTHEVFQLRMPLNPVLESPLGRLVRKWKCSLH